MKVLLLFITILTSLINFAQDGQFNFGARGSALANSSVTISDNYALFNNIAGIANISQYSGFVGYQSRYGLPELQVIGGGVLLPHPLLNAGVGYFKFGDEWFSQQKIHVGFANKIQQVSLGIAFDLLQYRISLGEEELISHSLAIQLGGIVEIHPKLLFGAHLYNVNQSKLNTEEINRIPTVMKSGISYRPTNELMLNVEIEKDLDFDEQVSFGIEYQLIDQLFLRTGISSSPKLHSFGVGFHPSRFYFDYSLSSTLLGNIHEVSVGLFANE